MPRLNVLEKFYVVSPLTKDANDVLWQKPNHDPSLCMSVYENTVYLNTHSEHCHGSMVGGFQYALGVGILENMKHKIAQMHAFKLSHVQIMQQHTKKIRFWLWLMILWYTICSYCHWMLGTSVESVRRSYGWKTLPTQLVSVCGR